MNVSPDEPAAAALTHINGMVRKNDGLFPQDSPVALIQSGKLKAQEGFEAMLNFLRKMIDEPYCRYQSKGHQHSKESNCTCLHKLRPTGPDDEVAEHRLRMISAHAVYFASLNAEMRTMLAMEWYSFAHVWSNQGKPLDYQYHLSVRSSEMFETRQDDDFWSNFHDLQEAIMSPRCCQNAMRLLYSYGSSRWSKVTTSFAERHVRPHGLKGKKSNRRNGVILEAEERLNTFFSDMQEDFAEVPATRMVRCLTGASLRKEEEGLVELPSYFTKRSLYKRFMYDSGYTIKISDKGNVKASVRTDDEWQSKNRPPLPILSWGTFTSYWQEHYPKMKIRVQSEDVCGECTIVQMRFKYNSFRLFAKSNSILPNTTELELFDILKNSLCQPCQEAEDAGGDGGAVDGGGSGQRGRDGVVEGGEAEDQVQVDSFVDDDPEQATNNKKDIELLSIALEHVKATDKQRKKHQLAKEDSLTAKLHWQVLTGEALRLPLQPRIQKLRYLLKFAFTGDYCQNMAIPYLGANQFGEAYYWSPLWVYCFGIADETSVDERTLMDAYYYFEHEGFKGGNNVASLIDKHFLKNNMLDKDDPIGEVVFSFDNCGGQNKNQIVLGYFAHRVEEGYFNKVVVCFLVRGHTKNACDRTFNLLKNEYRKKDLYSSKQLDEVLNKAEDVTATKVEADEFLDWAAAIKPLFSMPPSETKKNHNFTFTKESPGVIRISVYDGETERSYSCRARGGVAIDPKEREAYKQRSFPPPPEEKPVFTAIKRKELYDKWRPFVPEEHRIDSWFIDAPSAEDTARVLSDRAASKKRRMNTRTGGDTRKPAPVPATPAAASAPTALL